MNALKHAFAVGIALPAVLLLVLNVRTAWAGATDAVELGPAPTVDGYNPYTGRVSAAVCSLADPDRYFVAGADGGVWRTTDGGVSWVPLTDFMPTTAMGALALDPTDENVIYAGTGEANYANHSRYGLGLLKSTDGGDSWVQLAADTFAGRTFSRLIVHPQNPLVIYAAIARAGGFPELAAAKGHPDAEGPVGVFRSLDGGQTWEHLTSGLPNLAATDLALDPVNPSILYAGIGHIFGDADNGIYKTTDGGDSWTKLGGGLPTSSVGRVSVAVAPSNPNRLYALLTYPASSTGSGASMRGAYRSDNGGFTWTQLSALVNIQATYGWYLSVITVQPTDPDVVFMGGVTLYRSLNAGGSWSNVTPPHVDMHALAWDAAGRLVCGNDGGVHRTSNLGSSWTALNTGLGVIQFYAGLSVHPTDEEYFLGGTQDNGSNIRDEDSDEWVHVFGGDGGWTQIRPDSPSLIFVEYQGTGNLYRSPTGGSYFTFSGTGISTSDRNCFLPPYVIDPNQTNRMYYGTQRLYRSLNAGQNWTALTGDLTGGGDAAIRTLAVAPSDSGVIYAATNDGRILRSTDAGENFASIGLDFPGWPRVTREVFVHPTEPLTAYVATAYFDSHQIRRTRDVAAADGAPLWEILNPPKNVPINVVAVDVRGTFPVMYAGADDGLYRSVDEGQTWHRYGAGLPHTCVIDLILEAERQRLIVGTQGRGAWRVPIGIPGDCNCDGSVTYDDIDYFVAAIGGETAWTEFYADQHAGAPPPCPYVSCDPTGDGVVSYDDIDPFVALLGG